MFVDVQIIDNFLDSVMSVCLTKTEIIAGSVDGTIHTFDIRNGRYVALTRRYTLLLFPLCGAVFEMFLRLHLLRGLCLLRFPLDS